MFANSHGLDTDKITPLCLNIEKCLCFENIAIPLHPAYDCKRNKDGVLIVKNKKEYLPLTSDYRINIIAICGQNGTGKSTIINMLKMRNVPRESKYEIYWIDQEQNILSTSDAPIHLNGEKIIIEKEKFEIDSVNAFCGDDRHRDEANKPQRCFVNSYNKYRSIYDIDAPLFDYFHVEIDQRNYDFTGEAFASNWKDFISVEDHECEQFLKENPALFFLCHLIMDKNFKTLARELFPESVNAKTAFKTIKKHFLNASVLKIQNEYLSLLSDTSVDDVDEDGWTQTWREAKEDKRISYKIDDFQEIHDKVSDISTRADAAINALFSELNKDKGYKFNHYEDTLQDISIYSSYKIYGDQEKRFVNDLSQGEWNRLMMIYNLTPTVIQTDINWFSLDEPDNHLHPEWKRQFINNLLHTYKNITKGLALSQNEKRIGQRTLTCIIATHSPFILSDLTHDNIIFLKKENDLTRIHWPENDSFAGNIGEMYHSEFFMSHTIGEYAKSLIEATLKKLKSNSPCSDGELKRFELLFAKVGDPILKQLLMEKLDYAKSKS